MTMTIAMKLAGALMSVLSILMAAHAAERKLERLVISMSPELLT
jgi:hypothetical protein